MSNVTLTRDQVTFVMDMVCIDDPDKAVQRFMEILTEERVDPMNASAVINRIIEKMVKGI